MLSKFRSYQHAVMFHKAATQCRMPAYLKNQFLRASSSIALNLAEGTAKPSQKDRMKYYRIALGSLRECQAALDLSEHSHPDLQTMADRLGALVYKLCFSGKK